MVCVPTQYTPPTLRCTDIISHSRIKIHKIAGIETLDEWPGVKAWLERIEARSAVAEGMAIPR